MDGYLSFLFQLTDIQNPDKTNNIETPSTSRDGRPKRPNEDHSYSITNSKKKQRPANQLEEIYKETLDRLKSIENTIDGKLLCLESSVTERLDKINETMDMQMAKLNSNLENIAAILKM